MLAIIPWRIGKSSQFVLGGDYEHFMISEQIMGDTLKSIELKFEYIILN